MKNVIRNRTATATRRTVRFYLNHMDDDEFLKNHHSDTCTILILKLVS